MRSHAKALGVRVSADEFWGHRNQYLTSARRTDLKVPERGQ